jgi:spoIIIJ-associated protein
VTVEWVEVQGRSVEIAVEAALAELGLESAEAAEIEVLQEPARGFLGMGGQDAVVRVRRKPKSARRRRRRRGRGDRSGQQERGRERRPAAKKTKAEKPSRDKERRGEEKSSPSRRPRREPSTRETESKPVRTEREEAAEVDIESQRQVVHEFLEGLIDSFGLEGTVESFVGDEFIDVKVIGEQTEALVGQKGAVLQSVLELCRTIVQRKTQAGARIHLDIAGYTERRREALRIYVGRLAEQLRDEGGEIMLEPMNAADRKVVHDAAAELPGIRTFSEGEDPHRSVVLALDDAAAAASDEGDDPDEDPGEHE